MLGDCFSKLICLMVFSVSLIQNDLRNTETYEHLQKRYGTSFATAKMVLFHDLGAYKRKTPSSTTSRPSHRCYLLAFMILNVVNTFSIGNIENKITSFLPYRLFVFIFSSLSLAVNWRRLVSNARLHLRQLTHQRMIVWHVSWNCEECEARKTKNKKKAKTITQYGIEQRKKNTLNKYEEP